MEKILIRNVTFIDIKQREIKANDALKNALENLNARKKKMGSLSAIDEAERLRLEGLDKSRAENPNYLDPLFCSVRAAFASDDTGLQTILFDHKNGEIKIVVAAAPVAEARVVLVGEGEGDEALEAEDGADNREIVPANAKSAAEAAKDARIARVALVIGLLQKYGTPVPQLAQPKGGGAARPARSDPNHSLFLQGFYKAAGRVASHMDLAVRVLKLMASAVNIAGDSDKPAISALEFANVFDKLIEQGVSSRDPNLKLKVDDRLNREQALGDERPMHETLLVLPDLDGATDTQILAGNVQLIGPIIFASMFEELKVFQVVDRLVEMSQRGTLSLTRGKAGTRLYQYWRDAPNRMSESERQTVYAMTLGLPTGEPGVMGNADFQELWLRFVSSVSTLVRENRVDQLIRSNMPASFNQQLVKKAGRDLAANMSLHGFGMAFYAAADLNKQINEIIELLDDAELKAATGSRDIWGVIDQIAQTELGGARNSYKYRMLANSGGIITNWLSQNVDRMLDSSRAMIDLRDVEHPPQRLSGESALSNPKDYDLVSACEVWLADSAMGEQRVDQMSQPKESPQQTSRPIQIPSIARDLLDGTGLGLGMSAHGKPQYANGSGYPAY